MVLTFTSSQDKPFQEGTSSLYRTMSDHGLALKPLHLVMSGTLQTKRQI